MEKYTSFFLTFLFLGIFLFSSCCKIVHPTIPHDKSHNPKRISVIPDSTPTSTDTFTKPKTTFEKDLGEIVPTLEGKLQIKSRKNLSDNSANTFLIDIILDVPDDVDVYTKFVPIPHHPVTVVDGKDKKNVIGFLEIIDLKYLKKFKIQNVPEIDNLPKTYSIHIPMDNLPNHYGNILIYSPQTSKHNSNIGSGEGSNHTTEGKIKDPRR